MRRLTFAFGAILLVLVTAGSAFALTTVKIGDTVWVNTNGDSVKDADEPGISGATLTLAYLVDGAWVDLATTTTASDGTYKFAGLTPGYDYRVSVALPVGYEAYAANFDRDGTADGQSDAVVAANDLTFDFGYAPLSSIGDRVWNDVDNSGGADDLSEPGLNGVRVALYDATGSLVAETTTAAGTIDGAAVDGVYLFEGLRAGTYTVVVDADTIPAGMAQTYDLDGTLDNEATATLGWNESLRTLDFSYYAAPSEPVSISGTVWRDCDGDGVLDAGEALTLSGAVITLYDSTGAVVAADGITNPVTTGDDGTYAFGPLPAGSYRVVETNPADFTSTNAVPGTAGDKVDSDTIDVDATTAGNTYPNQDFLDTGGTPGIDLEKTGPSSAKRGDTITYHFKVTNTGNAMMDVTVADPMLGGVIFTKSGVKAGEVNEFDVTYTIPASGDLTAGTHGTATNLQTLCTTPTTPTCTTETLVNTATATGVTPCGTVTDTSSWTVTVTTTSTGSPAIDLVKTGPSSAKRGDTITYHFKVTNTGNVALDITVSDPMLGGTIWTKSAVPAGQINEFDVTYTIPASGDLTGGGHGTASNVKTSCTSGGWGGWGGWGSWPPACTTESLVNTATATGVSTCGTVTDTSSWTVTVSTSTPPTGSPVIDLVKTGPSTAKRGDTITYHFSVTNSGNTTLDITVSDPMLGGTIWSKSGVPAGQVNEFDVTYTIPTSGDLTSGAHGSGTNLKTSCTTGGGCGGGTTTTETLTNTATAKGVWYCQTVSDSSTWNVTVTKASGGCWTTYTQGGWGAKPAGKNAGKLLHDNWCSVFGSGCLAVGGCKTLNFTNAWAVTTFLPSRGTPNTLCWSHWNPTYRTEAGVLAGQVLTLKLNVCFSAAGVTKSGLGALKIQSGAYKGWTVDQLLGLAEAVLGGNTCGLRGSIADLSNACTAVNESFDGGSANTGYVAP